ncbi:hypothetical protein Aph01nite_28550 [Acrocarpospora phusangensis]|uniref:Uncharacterized protein n=1 Tax=Acrocarpospora phusangensis TaxID=1070424 RepID=A0A919UQG8_9ACTN|nr:hypothetical protein Aph01nite_28550 [Acrocarpospora phusangensis]
MEAEPEGPPFDRLPEAAEGLAVTGARGREQHGVVRTLGTTGTTGTTAGATVELSAGQWSRHAQHVLPDQERPGAEGQYREICDDQTTLAAETT